MTDNIRDIARRFQNYAEEIESLLSDSTFSEKQKKTDFLTRLVIPPPTKVTELLSDYLRHKAGFADKVRNKPDIALALVFLLRFYSNNLLNVSNLFPADKDDELLCSLLDGNQKIYFGLLDFLDANTERADTPDNPQ